MSVLKANEGVPASQAWCGEESEYGCEACRGLQRQCGVFIKPPDFDEEEPTVKVAPLFLDFDDDYLEMGDGTG